MLKRKSTTQIIENRSSPSSSNLNYLWPEVNKASKKCLCNYIALRQGSEYWLRTILFAFETVADITLPKLIDFMVMLNYDSANYLYKMLFAVWTKSWTLTWVPRLGDAYEWWTDDIPASGSRRGGGSVNGGSAPTDVVPEGILPVVGTRDSGSDIDWNSKYWSERY